MKHVMKRKTGKTTRDGTVSQECMSAYSGFVFAIVTHQHVEIKSSGSSHTNGRPKGRIRSMLKQDAQVCNYDTNHKTKEAAFKQRPTTT